MEKAYKVRFNSRSGGDKPYAAHQTKTSPEHGLALTDDGYLITAAKEIAQIEESFSQYGDGINSIECLGPFYYREIVK